KTVVVGTTTSANNLATSGAWQTVYAGNNDAIVGRFNNNGKLMCATYLGSNGKDFGYGITTDSKSNIIITGKTTSATGLATSGAYQEANGGNSDGFVSKFSP